MRFGFYVPNEGPFAHVRTLVSLARAAEAAGWDGFFLWDALRPILDPRGEGDGARPVPADVDDYAAAGVTWVLHQSLTVAGAHARIQAGPK